MTVDKLIERLREWKTHGLSGDAVVFSWDPDTGQDEEVTGFIFSDADNSVTFQTDKD